MERENLLKRYRQVHEKKNVKKEESDTKIISFCPPISQGACMSSHGRSTVLYGSNLCLLLTAFLCICFMYCIHAIYISIVFVLCWLYYIAQLSG